MAVNFKGLLAVFAAATLGVTTANGQDFEITGITIDNLSGVIGDLTVNDELVPNSEFVDSSLTGFVDSDQSLAYVFPFSPAPNPPSSLVRGFNVYTGLINPDSWQVTFDTPVVNTFGPDAVIFDVGRPDNSDGFTVSTGGGAVLDLSGANRPTPFATVFDFQFDIYGSTNTGNTPTVAALDSESFSLSSSLATSQRNFFLIDFDDLGVASGDPVSTLDFIGFDGFDPSGVIGLPEFAEPAVPPPSVIQAVDLGPGGVLNSLTLRGTTVPQSSLTGVTLTSFSDADNVQVLTSDGDVAPSPPSSVISDFSLDTGLANYSSITVTFDTPVENTPNEDIVLVDIGFPSDAFDLTINGITVTVVEGSQNFSTTEGFDFEIQTSDQGGPFTSVTQLDAATFTTNAADPFAPKNFIVVDLDDFGVANGATVTSVTIDNPPGGGYDTLGVFGLPEVIPTIIQGDYNGDGVVSAADYTVARDNLGKSANLFAFESRDPTNTGPINEADLTFWASQYGNVSAALMGSAVSVPEPGAVVLLTLGLVAIGSRRCN